MGVSTNLMSVADSDFESGIAGWAGASGVTVGWSTRFFNGAHSMSLATATTGTATATCRTRAAVTPGAEYMALAHFANATVGTAGRVSTVTVAWFAAPTGGTAISQVTSSAVPLPASTQWATPLTQLVGIPPAGAGWAEISVSVTGVSSGSAVVVDTVGFGPPVVWAGNLLPYTIAGAEIDTAGWSAGTNTTLDRRGGVSWEGWFSYQMTATAAGATRVALASPVPAAPGVEYEALFMAQAPTDTGQSGVFTVGLEYLDASGAVLTSLTAGWQLTAGTFRRCLVSLPAPAGTVSMRSVAMPHAAVAGQQWLFDQVLMQPAPVATGNLLTYNEASIEVNSSGWTAVSGCSIARSETRWWDGNASLAITTDGTADAVVSLARSVPITPGISFEFAPKFWRAGADSSTQTTVVVSVGFQTADGSSVGGTDPVWGLSGASGWFSPTASDVAPTGAVTMSATLRIPAGTAGTYYMDAVYVGPGGLAAVAIPIVGEYAARVSLSGLTEGARDVWDLSRVLADGSATAVRGQDGDLTGIPITGDVAVVDDFEAPLGVAVSYMVSTRKLVGVGENDISSDPIVIPGPDGVSVVLKDPGLPARSTTATVTTLPDWTRTARQGVNAVRGRVNPIVISDVRTSRTGSLVVTTQTDAEKVALWWLLDPGSTLLLQWPAGWSESDTYVQVGDVVEAHIVDYARYGDRTWTLPLTVVDRPIGGIVGSPDRTWGSLTTDPDISSWADVMAYGSWLNVLTGVRP